MVTHYLRNVHLTISEVNMIITEVRTVLNLFINKNFVIYAEINLIVIVKYIGMLEIIIIILKNIEVLHILYEI